MKKQVLFIQGGGEDGYEADLSLVASLQNELGEDYEIFYPKMPDDETAPDFGWLQEIENEMAKLNDDLIVVGHSLGASMLLKYFSENKVSKIVSGIFLIATPFWKGKEEWVQGLKLQADFAQNLPQHIPVFLYQCLDDEVVTLDQFVIYKQQLPWASFREIESGGHQLDNDLSLIAKDIRSL